MYLLLINFYLSLLNSIKYFQIHVFLTLSIISTFWIRPKNVQLSNFVAAHKTLEDL